MIVLGTLSLYIKYRIFIFSFYVNLIFYIGIISYCYGLYYNIYEYQVVDIPSKPK